MVRPYAVKGRKRKKMEGEYARDEVESLIEETSDAIATRNGDKTEEDVHELPGIPLASIDQKSKSRVTFILESASLEVGKNYQLLSSNEHAHFLRKHNKNPADYKPDIVLQVLLSIIDSPLAKAVRVRAIYVRTEKGVLFEVKPNVCIPRTLKRFSAVTEIKHYCCW